MISKDKNRVKKKTKKKVTNAATQQKEHYAQLFQDTDIPKIYVKVEMEEKKHCNIYQVI